MGFDREAVRVVCSVLEGVNKRTNIALGALDSLYLSAAPINAPCYERMHELIDNIVPVNWRGPEPRGEGK